MKLSIFKRQRSVQPKKFQGTSIQLFVSGKNACKCGRSNILPCFIRFVGHHFFIRVRRKKEPPFIKIQTNFTNSPVFRSSDSCFQTLCNETRESTEVSVKINRTHFAKFLKSSFIKSSWVLSQIRSYVQFKSQLFDYIDSIVLVSPLASSFCKSALLNILVTMKMM